MAAGLFSMGSGEVCQLGLGPDKMERKRPAHVKTLQAIPVSARAGSLHNAVISDTGSVYTWGCNDSHALGREGDTWLPEKVPYVQATQVGCGDSHTTVLSNDGHVVSWGTFHSASGHSSQTFSTAPRIVPSLRNVMHMASGSNYDLCVTRTGEVYEWGDVRNAKRSSPRLPEVHLTPRRIFINGFCYNTLRRQSLKVEKVFATAMTSFAVIRGGVSVYAWGLNNYGQCGVQSSEQFVTVPTCIHTLNRKKVVEIAGGLHHCLALDAQHQVYSWGRGHYGRLGHGKLSEDKRKETVARLGIKDSEADDKKIPTIIDALLPKGDDHIISISAGEAHSMAVTHQGHLYAWGFNDNCQLGLGHDEECWVPTRVPVPQGVATLQQQRHVLSSAGGSQHSIFIAKGGV